MTIDTDFGGFSISFENGESFDFTHGDQWEPVSSMLNRKQVEALRDMFDVALNTSAEELGDE